MMRVLTASGRLGIGAAVLMMLGTAGCAGTPEQPVQQKRLRIAVAGFAHETCTFCPKPTTVEDFEKGGVHRGDQVIEAVRGIPDYINGYIKVAEQDGNVDLVGIEDASNAWGGSSGSWITKEAFDKYTTEIADGLKKAGPFDGVLLALHGAMAAEEFPKAEAEIVRRVRAAVGSIPIMVTLDLHANEDEELTKAADGVFIIATYPHVDTEATGTVAARCMLDTIRGTFKPTQALRKPGVITPSVFQGTDLSPAKDIMARAREWEQKEPGVYRVSVAFGFAYADVPDAGATVIAVTNNDQALADKVAQDMSDYIWSVREPFANKKFPKTKEGVTQVIAAAKAGKTPVVIADHSDRTGDSTHILQELINQGATGFAIATLADPKAIQEIESKAKAGDAVAVAVGGWASEWSGKPVKLSGKVEFLGNCQYVATGPMGRGSTINLGTVAVVGFGQNNHVILTPTLHQVLDDAIFPAVGLDLKNLNIISLKSRVHFRAFYDNVAGTIIEIDAPGLGPADLTQFTYKNLPNDIYPIGKKWREGVK